MSQSPPVRLDRRKTGVVTLTLCRPEARNALDEATALAFSAAVAEIAADASARALVLAGEGKAFCGGGDLTMLNELAAAPPPVARLYMRKFYAYFLGIAELEIPVVAAIHGHAIGAGIAFTLAADVRVVANDAKVGFNFTRLGIPPGMGSTFFLPRVVGAARAAELLLSGRLVSGEEAVRLGICHEAAPSGDVRARADAIADDLASAAPLAVRLTKSALRRDLVGLDRALDEEAALQALAYPSEDLREGVAAAQARRTPVFQGR